MPALPPNYNSEDLEINSNNELEFADRTYSFSPTDFSGYGRKILRKNIQNVIQYDTRLTFSGVPFDYGYINFGIDNVNYNLFLFPDKKAIFTYRYDGEFDKWFSSGNGPIDMPIWEFYDAADTDIVSKTLKLNCGVYQVDTLEIIGVPTSNGNITVILDGNSYSIPVTTDMNVSAIALAIIQGMPLTGNWDYNMYSTTSGKLDFTARTFDNYTSLTVDAGTTGVTYTITHTATAQSQIDFAAAIQALDSYSTDDTSHTYYNLTDNYYCWIDTDGKLLTIIAKEVGAKAGHPQLLMGTTNFIIMPLVQMRENNDEGYVYYWDYGALSTTPDDLANLITNKPFSGVSITNNGDGTVTVSKIGSAAVITFTDADGTGVTISQTTSSQTVSKNVLTTADFPDANTIYEIRYDFWANGNIMLPDNCVLNFTGGSVNASIFLGNSTYIHGRKINVYNSVFQNLQNSEVVTNWFPGNLGYRIQAANNLYRYGGTRGTIKIKVPYGQTLTEPLIIDSDFVKIDGCGESIPTDTTVYNNHISFFKIQTSSSQLYVRKTAFTIDDIAFIGVVNRMGIVLDFQTLGASPNEGLNATNINIRYALQGIRFGNNTYGLTLDKCTLYETSIALSRNLFIPTNCGERITVKDGFIAQVQLGIVSCYRSESIRVVNCSFDYIRGTGAYSLNGGDIIIEGGHVEDAGAHITPLFVTGLGGYICISETFNYIFINSSSKSKTPLAYAFSDNRILTIEGSHNWGLYTQSGDFLIAGNGRGQVNGLKFNSGQQYNDSRISKPHGLLKDIVNINDKVVILHGGKVEYLSDKGIYHFVNYADQTRFYFIIKADYFVENGGMYGVVNSVIPKNLSEGGTSYQIGFEIGYARYNTSTNAIDRVPFSDNNTITLNKFRPGRLRSTIYPGYNNASGKSRPIDTQYEYIYMMIWSGFVEEFTMSLLEAYIGDSSARLVKASEYYLFNIDNILSPINGTFQITAGNVLTASTNFYDKVSTIAAIAGSMTFATANTDVTITLPFAPKSGGIFRCENTNGMLSFTLHGNSTTAQVQSSIVGVLSYNFTYKTI